MLGLSKVACAVSGGPQPGPPETPVGRHPVMSSQPQLWVLLCQEKPVIVIGKRVSQSGDVGLSAAEAERERSGEARKRVSVSKDFIVPLG